MSKKSKMLAGATVVAAGPSGLRRLAAGCLMLVLLGGLMLGALMGFAAWTARHSSSSKGAVALPCPPQAVAVVWSTRDAPQAARDAVTGALRQAGRRPTTSGWETGAQRDLVVVWSPGTGTSVSTTSAPVKLTLGAVPTAAQVRAALGARQAPCAAPAEAKTAPASAQPQESAQKPSAGRSWPWERGWSVTGWLGVVLAVWWLAGPNLVRGVARVLGMGLWPLRLGWRKSQRAAYRRRLRQGEQPVEWPMKPSPGQRWAEDPQALRDRRSYRQQIAKTEPERRKALRASIRQERLTGTGIGPVTLWQRIYRTPAPEGAPGKNGVSA